jgi:ubiquinone biosynthesis protein UbiJ
LKDSRLKVGPAPETSDLRVAATPGSLLAMLFRRDGDGMAPGKVEIAGDAELARRLEKLASGFAPDFEEAFARTFGDVLGVPLAKAVRKALAHARETARISPRMAPHWLRDEARIALAPGEVEGFLDEVDTLRERSRTSGARLATSGTRAQRNARDAAASCTGPATHRLVLLRYRLDELVDATHLFPSAETTCVRCWRNRASTCAQLSRGERDCGWR